MPKLPSCATGLGPWRRQPLNVREETPRLLLERPGPAAALCPVLVYFRASAEGTGNQAHGPQGWDHLSDPSQLKAGSG